MELPVLLLFAAMFILITVLGSLFLMHLRDHEKEQMEAEEFAQWLFERLRIERDSDD
jgi:hypothetical protein